MKPFKLIICLLAVTLFVACSKKKDGNSNPYPHNPYGTTPGYINNGLVGTTGLPGYQLPQGSCNGPTQMYSDLVSFCGFLARDAEAICNPAAVKQTFLQYCQSMATQLNYCVPQVQSGCFYSASGCVIGSRTVRYSSGYSSSDRTSRRERLSGDYRPSRPSSRPSVSRPIPAQDAPSVSAPIPSRPATVVSAPIERAEERNCVRQESKPWIDCRLKRGERASAVRGIDKKALRDFDFRRGSDGQTPFEKENRRGNIECKAPGSTKSTRNYIYSSYEQYVASLSRNCGDVVVSQPVPVQTAPVVSAPIQSRPEAITSPVADEAPAKVEELKQEKAFLAQCMNLEELHNYILNPANELSSYSAYTVSQPVAQNRTREYLDAYRVNINNVLTQSRMSVSGSTSQMSAIGLNVTQRGDRLQVDSTRGSGEIIDCRNRNSMTVKYSSSQGSEIVTYAWNGLRDDDLEIIETIRGTFAFRNETSDYIVSRYIGVGKKLNSKQIIAKVTADMKKKGLLGLDPNSGNRYEVINNGATSGK